MSSFANSVKATRVWFDESSMWLALDDGRMLAIPRIWFPKLDAATNEQLEKYELSGNGIGIQWDELDEDVSVPNLLLGYRACRPRMVLQK